MSDCWPLFKVPVAFPAGLQAEAFWCGKHRGVGWTGQPCTGVKVGGNKHD